MNKLGKMTLYGMAIFAIISCSNQKKEGDERVEKLLSQMTLQEKIGQMNQVTGMGLSDDMKELIRSGSAGTILNELDVKVVNELQRIAVEESRLGIPIIVGRDVIHGFKTIFPIPLGQAASWNPEIVKTGARIAAEEASSVGIRWTFAPMIDVTRDPRWGRIAESLGEDPYLTSIMGKAMIEGFQGDSLSSPTSIAACAKHFAAYGASEAGKDYNTTWIPELQLRELFLPPFEVAAKAGAATFMCSFNDINGVPSSGSQFLNQQVLRKEWGYDGVLVSDWGSIEQMIPHGFCLDLKDAAQKAALAGVDIDMMSYAYPSHLTALVESGAVPVKAIDDAVRRILQLKVKLGLFENPYTQEHTESAFYTEKALNAAQKAATESVVLLKNEKQSLPLSTQIKRLAIVGPLADSPIDQVGTWCFDAEPEHCITPLTAIKTAYEGTIQILYEPALSYSRDKNEQNIAKAVSAARNADAVVAFVGEEAVISGEARCRADISLPGAQSKLIAALKATGKPVIMVVMAGRPLTIETESANADAVLYAFHGGTMAGPALCDLLFGKVTPSGKLPVTIPRMVGQIPIYYNHKNTGRPAQNITLIDDIAKGTAQTSLGFTSYHLDAGDSPLYPFGYGLSYTTFEYAKPQLSANKIKADTPLNIRCKITNTGTRDAEEIVQLYVRDKVGSLVRPVKELKAFTKINIKAGATECVTFTLTTDDLAYWNADMVKRAEAGEFQLWVAPDSQRGESVNFLLK